MKVILAFLSVLLACNARASHFWGDDAQNLAAARRGSPPHVWSTEQNTTEDMLEASKATKGDDNDTAQVELFWQEEDWHPRTLSAHSMMATWLDKFYKSVPAAELSPPAPRHPVLKARGQSIPERIVTTYEEFDNDNHTWTQTKTDVCPSLKYPVPKTKDYLIMAPIGSSFDAHTWLKSPEYATFDVIGMYYGNNPNLTELCPRCTAVYQAKGTKWYLMYDFTQQHPEAWKQITKRYKAVMVADDDVEMDTCSLNRAFELFTAYDLLMAQPSLCVTAYRSTWWPYLYQQTGSILRFVTFVEIMSPIFLMDMFENFIMPSLHNAYTGWGLDFSWPFLLRYPRKKIGVLDEVCMLHASSAGQRTGEGNLYKVPVPYDEREEESRRVAEFGYYPSRVEAMGLPYRNMETLGIVRKPVSRADVIQNTATTTEDGSQQQTQTQQQQTDTMASAESSSSTGTAYKQESTSLLKKDFTTTTTSVESPQDGSAALSTSQSNDPYRAKFLQTSQSDTSFEHGLSFIAPVAIGVALGTFASAVVRGFSDRTRQSQSNVLPSIRKHHHRHAAV